VRKGIIIKDKLSVLTDDIRTGKTTKIFNWIEGKNVGGFLTPDVDGLRKFYDIHSGKYLAFESEIASYLTVGVGRFNFYKSAFNYGNELIINSINSEFNYFIIDEFGKLELQNMGFSTGIDELIKYLILNDFAGEYMIVVREFLVDDFLERYDLNVQEWSDFN